MQHCGRAIDISDLIGQPALRGADTYSATRPHGQPGD